MKTCFEYCLFPAHLRGRSDCVCRRGAEQALRDQDQQGGGEGQRGVEVSHRHQHAHDQKDRRVGSELTEFKANIFRQSTLLLFPQEPLIKSCPTSENF